MKAKQLRELLSQLSDDTEIVVAPVPDNAGFVNDFLPFLGKAHQTLQSHKKVKIAVLGLREETFFNEEIEINWPERPV